MRVVLGAVARRCARAKTNDSAGRRPATRTGVTAATRLRRDDGRSRKGEWRGAASTRRRRGDQPRVGAGAPGRTAMHAIQYKIQSERALFCIAVTSGPKFVQYPTAPESVIKSPQKLPEIVSRKNHFCQKITAQSAMSMRPHHVVVRSKLRHQPLISLSLTVTIPPTSPLCGVACTGAS